MAKVPLNEVDIKSLISLALQSKMSWNQLENLLTGLTPEESNQVIKVLLKELEALQSKLTEKHENDKISQGDVVLQEEEEVELVVTDIHLKSVEPNSENHFFQENEIDNEIPEEDNLMDNQVNEQKEPTEMIDNEWYMFVSNDNKTRGYNEIQFEDDKLENDEIKQGDELQISNGKKGFAKKISFDQHEMNRTVEQPRECKICNKRFNKPCSLNIHEKIHTGEQPYNCKTCFKRFNTSGALKRHENIHTGEAPYQCDKCNKRFTRLDHLKLHEQRHSGEKTFECQSQTCKKRFKEKCQLKIHERIHTGEVPYECKTCKKRFKRNYHLKSHEMTHTGEVPHECNSCHKRFTRLNNLKVHQRVHNKVQSQSSSKNSFG